MSFSETINSDKFKWVFLGLKLIVVFVLIYYIFSIIDWNVFIANVSKLQYWAFLVCFAMFYLIIWVSSLRWQFILNSFDIKISIKELIILNWKALFFSNFLPAVVGLEVVKYNYIRRQTGAPMAQIVNSILIDRILAFTSLLIFVAVFSTPLIQQVANDFLKLEIYMLYGLGALVLAVLLIGAYIILKFTGKLETFFVFYNKIFRLGFKSILAIFILNMAMLFFTVLNTVACIKGMGENIVFWDGMVATPLVIVSEYFPFAINSLGIREGVGIFLFKELGYQVEIIAATFIIVRITGIIFSSFGGFIYLYEKFKFLHLKPKKKA